VQICGVNDKRKETISIKGIGLFFAAVMGKSSISPAAEVGESLEVPVLRVSPEKGCSSASVFPSPSALSCASFPIPFDAFRIDSLL
jgi:hypothetical protein